MASGGGWNAFVLLLLIALIPSISSDIISVKGTTLPPPQCQCRPVPGSSADLVQFSLNWFVFQAEYFLQASIGRGINSVAPGLIQGLISNSSTGARLANLDPVIRRMIEEFGYKTVSHIRAIQANPLIRPIKAPRLNLSPEIFDTFLRTALSVSNFPIPPMNTCRRRLFNPYADTTSFLVTAFNFPLLIHQYFVGIQPLLTDRNLRVLAAGVLGVQSAQYGAIQSILSLRANATVPGLRVTVLTATVAIARFQNQFGMCGKKTEGIIVPVQLGAENRTASNVITADVNSLSFSRTAREILRIVFRTADASRPGGYFPNGINGALNRTIVALRLN